MNERNDKTYILFKILPVQKKKITLNTYNIILFINIFQLEKQRKNRQTIELIAARRH